MAITTKKRLLPLGVIGGTTVSFGTPSTSRFDVSQSQSTVSEGHPFRVFQQNPPPSLQRRKRKDPSWVPDLGGNFYTEKPFCEFDTTIHRVNSRNSYQGGPAYVYTGTLTPSWSPQWGTLRNMVNANVGTDVSLDAFGTSAIAKVIPTKPAADAAVSIAETFSEGIPKIVGLSLLKSRFKDIRKYGDEYLNYQFGWAPLVGDVGNVVDSFLNSEKKLRQLHRDSGKVIRRRFNGPLETDVNSVYVGLQYPQGMNTYMCPQGVGPFPLWRETKVVRQRWFSGAFTYHLSEDPQLDNLMLKLQEIKYLYGLKLDADVLWNLIPWSWAADWIANGGDIVSNLSAFSQDGLVMRYGYVMETTTVTITDTLIGVQLNGQPKRNLSTSHGWTVKKRRRATPYGFGLNEKDFSSYQAAIVAALGLTRLPGGRR